MEKSTDTEVKTLEDSKPDDIYHQNKKFIIRTDKQGNSFFVYGRSR